ncbi:MAG: glutamate racemase [Bacteroidales bacterium]|jgi:glutamate racemase
MKICKAGKPLIAIFDSGVGGLSVWRELTAILPDFHFIYLADNAYCPYGPRPQEEVIARTSLITDFFISQGAILIVVACNTATAAAIDSLRLNYDIPFIGMEPAVKTAALHSKSGVIGVLATLGTFNGKLYHRTLERFASDIKVIEKAGTGLVELVEAGKTSVPETIDLLKLYIEPMLKEGADHIVLGCTHYPFLTDEIRKITGDHVVIVDPAPAVALHTYNTLQQHGVVSEEKPDPLTQTIFYSTGPKENLMRVAKSILNAIPDEQFVEKSF